MSNVVEEKKDEQRRKSFTSSLFESGEKDPKARPITAGTSNAHSIISRQLLDLEILYLLNFGARSGYELKKQLLGMFDVNVSYGTIYPHLHALKRSGLISQTGFGENEISSSPLGKIVYALTQQGSSAARESIARLGKIGLTMQFIFNKVDLGQSRASFVPSKSKERESTLHTLQAILERRGYVVFRNVASKGLSGNEYCFDVLATKSVEPSQKERILVQTIDQRAGPPMGLDRAMKILVMAQDVGTKILLLAVPHLNLDVTDFLAFQGITLFDGNDWQSVLSDFLLRFGHSLE